MARFGWGNPILNLPTLKFNPALEKDTHGEAKADPDGQFEQGDIPQEIGQLAVSRLRVGQKRTARSRRITREANWPPERPIVESRAGLTTPDTSVPNIPLSTE